MFNDISTSMLGVASVVATNTKFCRYKTSASSAERGMVAPGGRLEEDALGLGCAGQRTPAALPVNAAQPGRGATASPGYSLRSPWRRQVRG